MIIKIKEDFTDAEKDELDLTVGEILSEKLDVYALRLREQFGWSDETKREFIADVLRYCADRL